MYIYIIIYKGSFDDKAIAITSSKEEAAKYCKANSVDGYKFKCKRVKVTEQVTELPY